MKYGPDLGALLARVFGIVAALLACLGVAGVLWATGFQFNWANLGLMTLAGGISGFATEAAVRKATDQ